MTGANSTPDKAQVRRLELLLSNVLRIGVGASLVLIALGALLTVASASTNRVAQRSMGDLRHGHLSLPGAAVPHTIPALLSGVGHLDGPALAMLGLLLLIATPVARVAASIFVFAASRDRTFVIITVVVLVILLGSFVFGRLTPG